MKKLLGLIGSVGLTASTIAASVAMVPVQIAATTNEKETLETTVNNENPAIAPFYGSNVNWVSRRIGSSDWRLRIGPKNSNLLASRSVEDIARWLRDSFIDNWGNRIPIGSARAIAKVLKRDPWVNNRNWFAWGRNNNGLYIEFSGYYIVGGDPA